MGDPPAAVAMTRDSPGVLHVVIRLCPGGTERLVIELCRRAGEGIRTAVCCLDEPGAWAGELTGIGVPVVALGRRPGFQPRLGWRIARLAGQVGASVLHCHQYSPFVYGAIAKLVRPGLRLVFTEHGRASDAAPSGRRRAANFVLGRVPGAFFAVSEELKLHMVREGFPAGRVGVLTNGIEPGPRPGDSERAEARSALGVTDEAFVVGTVARLDPVKGLGFLVDGFAALRRSLPEARLVLVGEGPERPVLETVVRERGLEGSVVLTGHRADARVLMAGFDVFVNSSVYEGVSLTILEAMAAGLPVIATRVGGSPEVVVDGVTGVLVPVRDPGALAKAVSSLASADVRRRMGDAGRERLLACFTLERMVRAYEAVYRGREPG